MTQFQFTDEQLVGFLLGALPTDERDAIARRLMIDADLADRIVRLQEIVSLIDEVQHSDNRTTSLVDKTINAIPNGSGGTMGLNGGLSRAQAVDRELRPSRATFYDVLAAVTICVVIASLLMPGVLGSRELARRIGCQNSLQNLGTSFASYADTTQDRSLPIIDRNGPLAFAGFYAIELNEFGLMEDVRSVRCPSSDYLLNFVGGLPSEQELIQMPNEQLDFWRRFAGGTYAYNLGVWHNGRYSPVQLKGRSHFAILSDLPRGPLLDVDCTCDELSRSESWLRDEICHALEMEQREFAMAPEIMSNSSSWGDIESRWFAHVGDGLNVLFEDGHVSFIRISRDLECYDNFFANRFGVQAVGLDEEDCVLGPSYSSPFSKSFIDSLIRVRQKSAKFVPASSQ